MLWEPNSGCPIAKAALVARNGTRHQMFFQHRLKLLKVVTEASDCGRSHYQRPGPRVIRMPTVLSG
jgi:hypothetical protein